MRPRVVLATRNAEKLAELRRIVEPRLSGIQVLGLDDVALYDEPAETGATFEANALIKARAAVDATGLPALGDDSGLCADALGGMPGVLSARWAGAARDDAANNALLLAQLADVPDERRGAQFRCAMALATPHGPSGAAVDVARLGVMRGRLLREPRGGAGFGYDPLFVADGQQLSNAELGPGAKDAISHRGQALRAVVPDVLRVLGAELPGT